MDSLHQRKQLKLNLGPLSPILSNIVLDELDKELEELGRTAKPV